MEILLDKNLQEMEQFVMSLDEPKFRAKQILNCLLCGKSIEESTTLPISLKSKLSSYVCLPIKIYQDIKGENAVKFLYELYDGNIIEGILMFHKYGNTLCVSTQVGCRMGCKFCASTLDGLIRNLTAGEILGQFVAVNKYLGGTLKNRKITNIVLMGSGEPLDNYDNVLKFLKLVTDENGFNVSRRNISLSTCGVVDKIDCLIEDFPGVVLTISLHTPFQEKREKIMPIAKVYSLDKLITSVRNYIEKTGRRAVFEYTLIDGINDSNADAQQLRLITKGLICHINLIPLNYVKERDLKTSNNIEKFKQQLENMGMSVTIRNSLGNDIEGACGQLRRRILGEKKGE